MTGKRKDGEQTSNRLKKQVNRGTKDEFETIALIVAEVSYIKEQVLRKLEAVGAGRLPGGVQPTAAKQAGEGSKSKK